MFRINIKNIYKITFVITGTIIGAGFASGQEIYTFFNKYGINRVNWNIYIYFANVIYNLQNIKNYFRK